MKAFYICMCILGTVLPFAAFAPWLFSQGPNITLLFQLASSNSISQFAWLDVLVSALVLIAFIWHEGRRLNMARLWLPSLGTCLVGVSLGLPLFLLLREIHITDQHTL
ncbi:DUF2834 domain-containing protein [Halioxenophilus aromaticivorans]|uniref:DUF2834 domain-containing protein n=1 Tax=Halioxenophilus aromaticivorans TaxID=1306992 RepID=A0AAV3TX43_9ALTE